MGWPTYFLVDDGQLRHLLGEYPKLAGDSFLASQLSRVPPQSLPQSPSHRRSSGNDRFIAEFVD
jgi:hypothetical protein